MSGDDRDALLDNTPEAVAMRRAREARAKAAREPAPAPRPSRRRIVLGVLTGGMAVAGLLGLRSRP